MVLVWITFIWVIAMIIYYTCKWRREKRESMIISKAGMRKYNKEPMKMNIGERLRKKKIKNYEGKYRRE